LAIQLHPNHSGTRLGLAMPDIVGQRWPLWQV
jgi:hypothetical protein